MGAASKNEDGRLQSGGQWKTAQTWPPRGFHNVKFYLHEGGSLTAIRPSGPAASRYEYQPEKPVPTILAKPGPTTNWAS